MSLWQLTPTEDQYERDTGLAQGYRLRSALDGHIQDLQQQQADYFQGEARRLVAHLDDMTQWLRPPSYYEGAGAPSPEEFGAPQYPVAQPSQTLDAYGFPVGAAETTQQLGQTTVPRPDIATAPPAESMAQVALGAGSPEAERTLGALSETAMRRTPGGNVVQAAAREMAPVGPMTAETPLGNVAGLAQLATVPWQVPQTAARAVMEAVPGGETPVVPGVSRETPVLGGLLTPDVGLPVAAGMLAGTPKDVVGLGQRVLAGLDDAMATISRGAGAAGRGLVRAGEAMPEGRLGALQGAASERTESLTRRYYHGTGTSFPAPEPKMFDVNGLYGPAYYLTDEPRIAASYAEGEGGGLGRILTRLAQRGVSTESRAAQVRPVDVPEGLRFLDAETTPDVADIRRIAQETPVGPAQAGLIQAADEIAAALREGDEAEFLGRQLWQYLAKQLGKSETNQVLARAGYDGVRHGGGQMTPLYDEYGREITHTALAVFPEALPKVRNALSGQPFGIVPGAVPPGGPGAFRTPQQAPSGAPTLTQVLRGAAGNPSVPEIRAGQIGMGVGAVGGAVTGPEDQTWQERAGRAATGAVLGGMAGAAGARLGRQALAGGRALAGRLATEAVPAERTAAEIVAEQRAGPTIPSPAAPRYDKLPQETRPYLQASDAEMHAATTQRRGVLSDAEVDRLARRIEQGQTAADWIAEGKTGRAYNAEELRAMGNTIASEGLRLDDLNTQYSKLLRSAPQEEVETLEAAIALQGEKLAALWTVFKGGRGETGRALRTLRMIAREAETAYGAPVGDALGITNLQNLTSGQAVARITKKLGGSAAVATKIREYQVLVQQGAPPTKIANFWASVDNPNVTLSDVIRTLRYNAMLSGPRTFEVDLYGTAGEIPWRLGRDAGASMARSIGERSVEPLRELGPEISGIFAGASKGWKALIETVQLGISTEAAKRGDLPRDITSRLSDKNKIGKALALSLDWTMRVKGGLNEWQFQTAYGMGMGRIAGKAATQEGLHGKAWAERVNELIQDPAKQTDKMRLEANGIAERMIYAQEATPLQEGLQQVRARLGLVGHAILPFFPTIYRITSLGIQRSPLGLLGTAGEVLTQAGRTYLFKGGVKKGVAPLNERLADNLLGTAAFAWFTGQALQGNISASGPDDKRERDVLRAQGWQPYSIRFPWGWTSYANLGPFAQPIAQAAAVGEAHNYRKAGASAPELFANGLGRYLKVFTEQSYLQSLGTVAQLLNDPQRFGEPFVTQTLATLVPEGSLLNTLGQLGDPYSRRPERGDVPGAIAARLPPTRQQQPINRDVFGQPVANPYQGAQALINPFRVAPQPTGPTATIRRYAGSTSATQDRQIAQAIEHVQNRQLHPDQYTLPTSAEIALYRRFFGRENQQYKDLISSAAALQRREHAARAAAR